MASDPAGAAYATVAGDVTTDAGARGALYALTAGLFDDPDQGTYRALDAGRIQDQAVDLLELTGLAVEPPDLTVDDDRQTMSARFNDLFAVGFAEVVDKTDGTVDSQGPPVSLYESDYRPEVSWNDVNLDLARAYEYFGCQVDQDRRYNHDHVRLQLEFMGYLCRREAMVDADVAAARLDLHDRHLRVVIEGIVDALASEPGTGFYGRLAAFLDRLSAADVAELATRQEGEGP